MVGPLAQWLNTKGLLIALTLSTWPLLGHAAAWDYDLHAHLLLSDPKSALSAWEELASDEKQSLKAQKMRIEILCALGDLPRTLHALQEYIQHAPSPKLLDHRELLEEMAWMVIARTCESSALLTRALAILASGACNDSRGVRLLMFALRSPHAVLRSMAAGIAGQMRDDCLQEEVIARLSQERVWEVRAALIEAVGSMGIQSVKHKLLAQFEADSTSEEERAACASAYITLNQSVHPQVLQGLLRSSRSSVRALACTLCAEHGDKDCIGLIKPLLDDPHPKVQAHALQTLGLYYKGAEREPLAERVIALMKSEEIEVALTSAWFLAPIRPQMAMECIKKALADARTYVRHFASGVLATTGTYGTPLMRECLSVQDLYVRINAALGCLSVRHAVVVSGTCLEQALANEERFMWREEGIFRFVAPSIVCAKEEMPDYPEAINQLTRLQLLHRLTMVGHPYAQRAMKRFLQDSVLSITGTLTSLAIMEGDKDVLQQVYLLQKDPNRRVAVQAALVLSLWGRDVRSISVLEESYQGADHAMKSMILEAIGRVGHACSLPFLLRTLQEPSEQLRLLSAMALLGCLQKS